jgi:hypothetical protein
MVKTAYCCVEAAWEGMYPEILVVQHRCDFCMSYSRCQPADDHVRRGMMASTARR